jgi:hypothetical protein
LFDRQPDRLSPLLLQQRRNLLLLMLGERSTTLRPNAIVLAVVALASCGALAAFVVLSVTGFVAVIGIGLAIWFGIASLFSP